MTNPISNTGLNPQYVDANKREKETPATKEPVAETTEVARSGEVTVDRANELYAQQLDREVNDNITNEEEARVAVRDLREMIQSDPQAVMGAYGQASSATVEAIL